MTRKSPQATSRSPSARRSRRSTATPRTSPTPTPAYLADTLGVTPGTVTATVKRLADRGLVDHRPYHGVSFTPTGRRLAVGAIRRHRIVERFLADMLGYAWNEADRLAPTFEHDLPDEVVDRLFVALNRPDTCPHGFPIPEPEQDEIPALPPLYEPRDRRGRRGRGARLDRPRRRAVPRRASACGPACRSRSARSTRSTARWCCGSTARTAPSASGWLARSSSARSTRTGDSVVVDAQGRNHRMTSLLAAEGGYQAFTLGTAEWAWLFVSAGVAVLALILGFILMRGVLAAGCRAPRRCRRSPAPSRRAPAPT